MMKVDQAYMDEYVIKPMMNQFDELRKLIKSNNKNVIQKIGWMSDNIAKIPKKKR